MISYFGCHYSKSAYASELKSDIAVNTCYKQKQTNKIKTQIFKFSSTVILTSMKEVHGRGEKINDDLSLEQRLSPTLLDSFI